MTWLWIYSKLTFSDILQLEAKDSEPEDGEISSSDESLSESEDDQNEIQTEFGSATTVTLLPTPCIRIVIVETAEDMPIGKLFIVTCTGEYFKAVFKLFIMIRSLP